MKKKIKKQLVDYHKHLIQSLKNPEEARAYLNVSLEEDDDDPMSFLIALRNVVEAQGVTKTAKLAKLHRVSLYKMFSHRGNPGLFSVYAILRSLGLILKVDLAKKAA